MIPFQRQQLRKYFIMGSQDCGNREPLKVLEEALEAGITAFQFREKGKGASSDREKIALGHALRRLCASFHVPFIVNDDITLVDTLEADGMHVGQDDQPLSQLREQFPEHIIGLSISNDQERHDSPIQLADYVGAGPVFSTTSKADAKDTVGTRWIKTLRADYPELPIVGIGGITVQNAESVINAGADGVSVISAITKAESIKQAVDQL